jgi:hypothetical protein
VIDPVTLRERSSSPAAEAIGSNGLLRSYAHGLAASGETGRAVALLLRLRETNATATVYDRRLAAAFLLADSRGPEAARLLEGVPSLPPEAAVAAAGETLANPLRRDIDVPVLDAMGIPPDHPEAVRAMMLWFVANQRVEPAQRFARRLLEMAPGDAEARGVLGLRAGEPDRVLAPSVPDSLW